MVQTIYCLEMKFSKHRFCNFIRFKTFWIQKSNLVGRSLSLVCVCVINITHKIISRKTKFGILNRYHIWMFFKILKIALIVCARDRTTEFKQFAIYEKIMRKLLVSQINEIFLILSRFKFPNLMFLCYIK